MCIVVAFSGFCFLNMSVCVLYSSESRGQTQRHRGLELRGSSAANGEERARPLIPAIQIIIHVSWCLLMEVGISSPVTRSISASLDLGSHFDYPVRSRRAAPVLDAALSTVNSLVPIYRGGQSRHYWAVVYLYKSAGTRSVTAPFSPAILESPVSFWLRYVVMQLRPAQKNFMSLEYVVARSSFLFL